MSAYCRRCGGPLDTGGFCWRCVRAALSASLLAAALCAVCAGCARWPAPACPCRPFNEPDYDEEVTAMIDFRCSRVTDGSGGVPVRCCLVWEHAHCLVCGNAVEARDLGGALLEICAHHDGAAGQRCEGAEADLLEEHAELLRRAAVGA